MEDTSWIAIYLPLLVVFTMLFIEEQRKQVFRRALRKRRKGGFQIMNNQLIEKLLGQECVITVNSSFGEQGKIISVVDNWIEIETKKGDNKLVNIDYVTGIKPKK